MNVFLVDDHGMMREALKGFLKKKLGREVVFFEAASVPDALRIAEWPDLVLLDMQMKVKPSGIEGLAALKTKLPDAKVVIVSGDEDRDTILRCIELGALGYVPKSYSLELLNAAIAIVLRGVIYLPPAILGVDSPPPRPAKVAANADPAPAPPAVADHPGLSHLTSRQLQTLELLMSGKSNKSIARELAISQGTVKQHLANLYRALSVGGRVEAVCLVSKLGVAFPSPAAAKIA